MGQISVPTRIPSSTKDHGHSKYELYASNLEIMVLWGRRNLSITESDVIAETNDETGVINHTIHTTNQPPTTLFPQNQHPINLNLFCPR